MAEHERNGGPSGVRRRRRRGAGLALAALLGTVVGVSATEVIDPPDPAAAVFPAPAGLTTLAGSGSDIPADGSATTAGFGEIIDIAADASDQWLYAIDRGPGSDGPYSIRKVSTATGATTTLATGGYLDVTTERIAVDGDGNPWVAVVVGGAKGLVRYDRLSGTPTVMLSGMTGNAGDAFIFDGGYVYYASEGAPTDPFNPWIWKIAVSGLPASASSGTPVAGTGHQDRGPIRDIEKAPDGSFYFVWRGASTQCTCTALMRLNGSTMSFVVHGWADNRNNLAFSPRSMSLYYACDYFCDQIQRRPNGGTGPASTVAGSTPGDDDGDPGQLSLPSSIEISSDGSTGWVGDFGNHRIRQFKLPPDPYELSLDEGCAECNKGERRLSMPDIFEPVDIAAGTLTDSFADLVLPGRGVPAAITRTYNSYFSAKTGLFGPGWSSPLDMRVEERTGIISVTQENGALLPFARLTNGTIDSPPRVTSELEDVSGGGWKLTRNRTDVTTFDASGRVTGWRDRHNYTTAVSYPSATQIVITNPGGRTLTLTKDGSGRVTSVSDDSTPARTVTYGYTSGRLSSTTSFKVNAADAAPVSWGYAYDGAGRLNKVTDPRGRSNLTHYDGQGRVDYQLDFSLSGTSGARSDLAYSGTFPNQYRVATLPAHDGSGTRAKVRYNMTGNLITSMITGYQTASARTTAYEYYPETLFLKEVKVAGVRQATYTYDEHGNVDTTIDAASRTTDFGTYDAFNNPLSVTDPAGNQSTFTYTATGHLQQASIPIKTLGGASHGTAVTTYEHSDSAHPEDVTATIAPDQQGLPTPKKAEFSYRAGDGQVSWMEDAENNRTSYGYDSRGFVTSTVTPRGNATATVGDYETILAVNDFGMVRSVTDPLGEVSSQVYDGNGSIVSVTDANGQVATTVYDDMDRPTSVTSADGSADEVTTDTTYYPNGAVHEQLNGLGKATTYTYDVHGAVASSEDANAKVTGFRYDGIGRLQYRIDPGGTCPSATGCTTYGYSAGNELETVSYSDPATPDVTNVDYDLLGQRTLIERSAGSDESWTWDNRGQLRSSTDVNGRTTGSTWTKNGNLASVTYPDPAMTVTYAYDAADRMTSATEGARVTQFSWTADSQWENTTFPSGTTNLDTRTYDEAGRLGSVEWKKGATSLGKLTYGRDDEGLVESETPTGGTFSTKTWGYDDVDRLEQVDATPLTLDDAGNLIRAENGSYQAFDDAQQLCWVSPTTQSSCDAPPVDATFFGYDDRGNRTAMDHPGVAQDATYGYDQANRMTSAVETGDAPISAMTADDAVVGDFDGDADDDVFWYHPGATQDWVSWGTGNDRAGFGLDASPYSVNGTFEPFAGDFDCDGHEDIFWYAPGAGADSVWFWFYNGVDDYTSRSFPVNGTYTPVVGNFDGDEDPISGLGCDDVYWYGPDTAADTIWWGGAAVGTGSAFTSQAVSRGGTFEPIAGDFDNNGSDDIFWYQPGTGADDVYYGTTTRNSWISPAAGSKPVINGTTYDLAVSDFDGDHKDDVFLYSSTSGQAWWGGAIGTMGQSGYTQFVTVAAGYQIDGGDLDGDGKGDLLAYEPTGTGTDTVYWGTTRATFGSAAYRGLTLDPNAATYAYDAEGLRSSKTVNGTATQFTWNTGSGLPLLLGQHRSGATTQIVYGPGSTAIYEVTGGVVTYYHQDQQGSTRLTTASTGNAVSRYAYGAYGDMTTNTAPTVPTPVLGYSGQYTDSETGLIYLRSRYMDPTTGQFMSRDPIVSSTGQPYSYAGADPINRHDPSGLCGFMGDGPCNPVGISEDINERAQEAKEAVGICSEAYDDDEDCETISEDHPAAVPVIATVAIVAVAAPVCFTYIQGCVVFATTAPTLLGFGFSLWGLAGSLDGCDENDRKFIRAGLNGQGVQTPGGQGGGASPPDPQLPVPGPNSVGPQAQPGPAPGGQMPQSGNPGVRPGGVP